MTERDKVPAAMRPVFEEITAVIDAFCADYLDDEYARLARGLTAKLARKRPSPLARGDRRIWAAGIVHTIGRVNFLHDPEQRPHLRTEDLASRFGVKAQTMGNKARLIEDTLRIGAMEVEWCRQDMLVKNPFVWLVEIDGHLADARQLPEEIQVFLVDRGIIPFVPSRETGT